MAESPPQINALLPPRFLFQIAVPVRRAKPPGPKGPAPLDADYTLPDLASLDRDTPASERRFAEVRMAWAPEGLTFVVDVKGKNQPLWCRGSRADESDGLQVWIDTRATHSIHRASKFCTRLVFLPSGGGRDGTGPVADQLLINRARENARPVRPRELMTSSKVTASGYRLAAFVPAATLTGYDPEQHPRLGFNYTVVDRELGLQTFANGASLPHDEDPSCWATLELVDG